ncbi:hypothetical protein BGW80DRAFT_1305250 [Lactifluus volemus]|nr:hypothetical protein BGW80DRAFT_1305250 [Lactifluus volemus]
MSETNKWVLNVTSAPLFFLLAQLIIAVVLFCLCNALKIITLPMMRLDLPTVKGLAPTVVFNVLSLSCPRLLLPFTVLTSYLMLQTRPGLRILLSCSIITFGFFIGVFLDGTQISTLGVLFGITSSLMTAIHAAVMKRGFKVVEGSALSMSWYSNLLSAVLLVPFVIVLGEGPAALDLLYGRGEGFWTFIMAQRSAVGFLLSIAGILSIKVTSPITHMISSAIRGVAASILGVTLFGDLLTLGRVWAIIIILGGSIYYTWVKHTESLAPQYEQVAMKGLEEGVGKEHWGNTKAES